MYPDQAMNQVDALAFCRKQHGAGAALPSLAAIQAAQALVQQAQVRRWWG